MCRWMGICVGRDYAFLSSSPRCWWTGRFKNHCLRPVFPFQWCGDEAPTESTCVPQSKTEHRKCSVKAYWMTEQTNANSWGFWASPSLTLTIVNSKCCSSYLNPKPGVFHFSKAEKCLLGLFLKCSPLGPPAEGLAEQGAWDSAFWSALWAILFQEHLLENTAFKWWGQDPMA